MQDQRKNTTEWTNRKGKMVALYPTISKTKLNLNDLKKIERQKLSDCVLENITQPPDVYKKFTLNKKFK